MYPNNGGNYLWRSPRGAAVIVVLIILSVNLPHCTSHLASLFNSGGGLPLQNPKSQNNPIQPLIIPHHITRVSRDPSIRTDDDGVGDLGLGLSSSTRLNLHQSRQRPNRFSQFQYPSGNNEGGSAISSNEFNQQHHHTHGKLYTPPSSLGSGLTSTLFDGSLSGPTLGDNFVDLTIPRHHQHPHQHNHHHNHDLEDDEDNPAFTPFISARALSNMGKFFEHLQENLLAIQQDRSGGGTSLEIGQPERRRMTSESSIALADDEPPAAAAAADTSSQDYDGSPETKAAATMALRWQPPASGVFRTAETSFSSSPAPAPVPVPAPSSLVSTLSTSSSSGGGGNSRIGGGRGSRFQKMQTFFQPLSEDEVLLRRANNYNPSWLWTNMGLGKRRRR